jgi:peptide-methionine (S)-S-oxide reductase
MTAAGRAVMASLVAGGAALALLAGGPAESAKAVAIPAPAIDAKTEVRPATAILAGGCFWGMEAVFQHVKGVQSVVSGYAGGTAATANYRAVSSERTRHAEAIRIVYDPAVVSYGTLLRVYFSVAHDPTQRNRQGPDVGPSYRSAIFPVNPAQQRVARAYIAQLDKAGAWRKPIATTIEQGRFFEAEPYHQDFMNRNPEHGYIRRWDVPKLATYKAAFPGLYRAKSAP